MTLDFDKIKEIFELSIERHQVHQTVSNSDFPSQEQESVAYQVMHLQSRGYVEADYIPHLRAPETPAEFTIKGLTFEGHSLLKLMRDEAMWERTKQVVEQSGAELGFDAIQAALSTVITSMLLEKEC